MADKSKEESGLKGRMADFAPVIVKKGEKKGK